MADGHFFQDAPSVGWIDWSLRLIPWISVEKEPSILRASESFLKSLIAIRPISTNPNFANEYSLFLQTHFYNTSHPVKLSIPPHIFKTHLESKALLGVELRDGKQLIGIVFCWKAGILCGEPTGLITWLCVHPLWLRRGVTNRLLRAMWKLAQPMPSFWFRNDGWLKSPLPPVMTETRIVRSKRGQQTILVPFKTSSYNIQHIPFNKNMQNIFKKKDQKSIVLSLDKPPLLETWRYIVNQYTTLYVFLQPTFEQERFSNEDWCEVVAWHIETSKSTSDFEIAQYTEAIWNAIQYTWIDAPKSMPHIENLWHLGGQSSWSVVGLDPGSSIRSVVSFAMV